MPCPQAGHERLRKDANMIDFVLIASGLLLLFLGGEALIKGAVALARHLGLSQLLVSAVIIGFGTSMPEMTVSVGAALKGSPEIALGNVVGSNIANILLIVGLSALIFPFVQNAQAVRRDVLAMIGASLLLCALTLYGALGFFSGLIMLSGLFVYISWCCVQDLKKPDNAETTVENVDGENHPPVPMAFMYSFVGLGLLVGGAYLLVEGAIALARDFGLSEAVIGLTIVAVGTSLPELATAVVAAMRRQSDIIVGNILGSNIFNILAILGVTAMVEPIPMTGQIASTDIWIMLAVALSFSALLWLGLRIGRPVGLGMLAAYCAYTGWLYAGSMV